MMRKNKGKKILLAVLAAMLACCVLAPFALAGQTQPEAGVGTAAAAGSVCTSHVHDATCGYAEAAPGSPCAAEAAHVHDGACGWDEAAGAPCAFAHVHDETCGWAAPTEASPCTHVCTDACTGLDAGAALAAPEVGVLAGAVVAVTNQNQLMLALALAYEVEIQLQNDIELTTHTMVPVCKGGAPGAVVTKTLTSAPGAQYSIYPSTPYGMELVRVEADSQLVLTNVVLDGMQLDVDPANDETSALLRVDEGAGATIGAGAVLQNRSRFISATANEFGGGVYNEGTLVLDGGQITNNVAYLGAGIYNTGKVTIESGHVSGNISRNDGGGAYNTNLDLAGNWHEVTFRMNGGAVKGNSAGKNGGGMANFANLPATTVRPELGSEVTVLLYGGVIHDNRAAYDGGGICNTADGTHGIHKSLLIVRLHEMELKNNTAVRGGGMYNLSLGLSEVDVLMGSSSILNNTATGTMADMDVIDTEPVGGGGIYSQAGAGMPASQKHEDGVVTVVQSAGARIEGNTAPNGVGGGVLNYSDTYSQGNNWLLDYPAISRGISYIMRGGTIAGNSAVRGGGVYNRAGLGVMGQPRRGDLLFRMEEEGPTIAQNASTGTDTSIGTGALYDAGGGVMNTCYGGGSRLEFQMRAGEISQNTAAKGAGIANSDEPNSTNLNTTFSGDALVTGNYGNTGSRNGQGLFSMNRSIAGGYVTVGGNARLGTSLLDNNTYLWTFVVMPDEQLNRLVMAPDLTGDARVYMSAYRMGDSLTTAPNTVAENWLAAVNGAGAALPTAEQAAVFRGIDSFNYDFETNPAFIGVPGNGLGVTPAKNWDNAAANGARWGAAFYADSIQAGTDNKDVFIDDGVTILYNAGTGQATGGSVKLDGRQWEYSGMGMALFANLDLPVEKASYGKVISVEASGVTHPTLGTQLFPISGQITTANQPITGTPLGSYKLGTNGTLASTLQKERGDLLRVALENTDGSLVDLTDGEEVVIGEGSTVITLQTKFLEGLTPGNYNMVAFFRDGYADLPFAVLDKDISQSDPSDSDPSDSDPSDSDPSDSDPSDSDPSDSDPSGSDSTPAGPTSPQTGDTAGAVGAVAALALVATLGLGWVRGRFM